MSDKVRELSEELYCEPDERWCSADVIEYKIRAALEPLLRLLKRSQVCLAEEEYPLADEVAAELQHWHSMERTPE